MIIDVSYLTESQILIPTRQPTLEMQTDDNIRAFRCPVYREAIKESVYLVPTHAITVTWYGGRDFEIDYDKEWDEAYTKVRQAWMERSGVDPQNTSRYAAQRVLGCKNAGCSLHQGSLMLNFFTGMVVRTPETIRTFITRPINRPNPNWTVQDGVYRTGTFCGEFSINLQIMRTGTPITIRAYEPIASMIFLSDHEHPDMILHHPNSDASEKASRDADVFYLRKDYGEGYEKQCPHAD